MTSCDSNQPTTCNEGWLLLRLEALFCSIHLQCEGLISFLSPSNGIYMESIRSNYETYSTVEKCSVIIFDHVCFIIY